MIKAFWRNRRSWIALCQPCGYWSAFFYQLCPFGHRIVIILRCRLSKDIVGQLVRYPDI